MPKLSGFKVRIEAFVPIDKKDFGKQAAAFAMMDTISRTKQLPTDFWNTATIISVDAKQGSAEPPAAPAGEQGDMSDPATTALTTDPLPEGATVLEQADALDQTVIQTVKLADGTEVLRRISHEQDTAERGGQPVPAAKSKKK